MLLIKALIMPLFTNCDSIYSTNLQAGDVRSLNMAFSACIRFVFRLRRYDSTRQFSNRILGCPIITYLVLRNCLFIHSLLIGKTPDYLYKKLRQDSSLRSLTLIIPNHVTMQYNRSFFVRSVSNYNRLPIHIKTLNSIYTFKKACLNYAADALSSMS